jgi:hypothetical protein
MASTSRTKRLWVLSIAGGAALLVAGAFVASWPLLVARYRCHRLDEAATYAEARPWLDLLAADAGKPDPGVEALLSSLGGSRPSLTLWFFQGVLEGAIPSGTLRTFALRMERDESILASWSHYVRWVRGDELWGYLSSLSSGGPEAEGGESFPCFTPGATSGPRVGQMAPSATMVVQATATPAEEGHVHATPKQIEGLALAWYLGITPLPGLDGIVEGRIAEWLRGARPFLRHLVHDDALGRCKRETEFEPLPSLTPYSERGLPVPDVPLPGWTGPPPPRPRGAGTGVPAPGGRLLFPPAGGG